MTSSKGLPITAAAVGELRKITGAGMMECKKALEQAEGDLEQAVEILHKAGQAKAIKKIDDVIAEGSIVVAIAPNAQKGVILEINCQTDFVARSEDFRAFAQQVADLALSQTNPSAEALMAQFEPQRLALISKLGENISLRRIHSLVAPNQGVIGHYLHGDAQSSRVAALISIDTQNPALAKDLAMQVVAMNPEYLQVSDVPESRLLQEKGSTALCLSTQPFLKDEQQTVADLLKAHQTTVQVFIRMAVGEGIEKKSSNFAEEVRQQTEAFMSGR